MPVFIYTGVWTSPGPDSGPGLRMVTAASAPGQRRTRIADRAIPPAELTFMAERAGARITDVNAGHLSLISKPSVVTSVILQAAQAPG